MKISNKNGDCVIGRVGSDCCFCYQLCLPELCSCTVQLLSLLSVDCVCKIIPKKKKKKGLAYTCAVNLVVSCNRSLLVHGDNSFVTPLHLLSMDPLLSVADILTCLSMTEIQESLPENTFSYSEKRS
jgi:hypothetical protein